MGCQSLHLGFSGEPKVIVMVVGLRMELWRTTEDSQVCEKQWMEAMATARQETREKVDNVKRWWNKHKPDDSVTISEDTVYHFTSNCHWPCILQLFVLMLCSFTIQLWIKQKQWRWPCRIFVKKASLPQVLIFPLYFMCSFNWKHFFINSNPNKALMLNPFHGVEKTACKKMSWGSNRLTAMESCFSFDVDLWKDWLTAPNQRWPRCREKRRTKATDWWMV